METVSVLFLFIFDFMKKISLFEMFIEMNREIVGFEIHKLNTNEVIGLD